MARESLSEFIANMAKQRTALGTPVRPDQITPASSPSFSTGPSPYTPQFSPADMGRLNERAAAPLSMTGRDISIALGQPVAPSTAPMPGGMDRLSEQPIAPLRPNAPIIGTQMPQGPSPAMSTPSIAPSPVAPTSPTSGLRTKGGAPLQEFLSGSAMPEYGMPRAQADFLTQRQMGAPDAYNALSLDRQLRSGGTGSYAGDSAAMQARIANRPDFNQPYARSPYAREGASARDAAGLTQGDYRNIARAQGWEGSAQVAMSKKMFNESMQAGQPSAQDRLEAMKTAEQIETERVRRAEILQNMEMKGVKLGAEKQEEILREVSAINNAAGQASTIQEIGTKAGRQAGPFTSGLFAPLRFVGGTAAADLEANLNILGSDAFINNITKMRQDNPNGAAVGNVSDADVELMKSLQASFLQKQSPTQLKSNIQRYMDTRQKVVDDMKKGFIRKYGPEAFEATFGGGGQGQAEGGAEGGRPDLSGTGYSYAD